ncbi:MAG: hypothetical protein QOI06_2532 [Nocardioidaceae bacterium]|jgi:hypothetical protein|nr:hypothetical protein [Nocardioidaceae bacterium]
MMDENSDLQPEITAETRRGIRLLGFARPTGDRRPRVLIMGR